MYITIEIHYSASSKAYQKGSFQLRGKRPEMIALEFWKQIQKDMSYQAELDKVTAAEEDITPQLKDLEKAERKRKDNMADYLPF